MYTYRVLNDQDLVTISNGQGILAKKQTDYSAYLKELFQTINSHLLYGTDKQSSWISTSTSFSKIVLRYNTARGQFENERKPIAIIKNHYQNAIITKQGFNIFKRGLDFIGNHIDVVWESQVDHTKQVDIDVSDRKVGKKLGQIGIILTKEGRLCGNNVLALGYAGDNSEILVLNEIKQDDIVGILSPLEIDIAYLASGQEIFDSVLFKVLNKKLPLADIYAHLSALQKKIFEDLYIHNMHLNQVVYAVWKDNPNSDLFSLYSTFRLIKKHLLLSISELYDVDILQAKVVEDNLLVVQSEIRRNDYGKTVTYKGMEIPLYSVQEDYQKRIESDVKFVTLAVKGKEDITEENTYWLSSNTMYQSIMSTHVIDDLSLFAKEDVGKLR